MNRRHPTRPPAGNLLLPCGILLAALSAVFSAPPAFSQAPAEVHAPTPEEKKKELAADTAKLYELANQLKVEMDKSNKDTLSIGVLKKAEQVEKLAHKVREEMKASLANP